MADAESISLEETNKIRISLGLKPLTDDKAPATDKDKEAQDNYAKVRQTEAKERSDKALRDKIAKVRNKHELNARLKGATLGEADEDDGDTLAWVKKSKKREKELAKKRQQELEEMDKMFQENYGEEDLAGLKVSHDMDALDEGEQQILTLKDSRILDNEEDELQNVLMAEHERTTQRLDLKTKKKGYTGYDDDEFTDGQAGMKRHVLSKYDEDINGPQEQGFRLGMSVKVQKNAKEQTEESTTVVNRSLLTIDYAKNLDTSDYVQEGDVGFKKPKKKKRANRRVVESEISESKDDPDAMQIDNAPNMDSNFVDDDELQAALARSRKAKMRKIPKLTPEEIARRIAAEREEADADNTMNVDEEVGLTIDDTSEFVQGITLDTKPERRVLVIPTAPQQPDDAMDEDEPMEEMEAGEVDAREEEEMQAALLALEGLYGEPESKPAEQPDSEVGTAAERTHSSGLAGTLSILRATGALQESSKDAKEREKMQKQQDLWLADNRARAAKRELDRLISRGANKDQQQREYENRLREQQEARDALDSFKNYKPDVNIVYHDEFGREMTAKEAWKALSHRFHGKGSGQMKTEKRLKKIAEEKKREGMVSGETPLGMTSAFQTRQAKLGQAHMVLSVGNRGAAPDLGQYVETPNLVKPKAEKKKKGKDADKNTGPGPLVDVTHFVNPVALAPTDNGAANGISNGAGATPRARFAPVGSFVAHPAYNGGETSPAPLGGRVALSLKRKAEDEGTGTPPSKKR